MRNSIIFSFLSMFFCAAPEFSFAVADDYSGADRGSSSRKRPRECTDNGHRSTKRRKGLDSNPLYDSIEETPEFSSFLEAIERTRVESLHSYPNKIIAAIAILIENAQIIGESSYTMYQKLQIRESPAQQVLKAYEEFNGTELRIPNNFTEEQLFHLFDEIRSKLKNPRFPFGRNFLEQAEFRRRELNEKILAQRELRKAMPKARERERIETSRQEAEWLEQKRLESEGVYSGKEYLKRIRVAGQEAALLEREAIKAEKKEARLQKKLLKELAQRESEERARLRRKEDIRIQTEIFAKAKEQWLRQKQQELEAAELIRTNSDENTAKDNR